MRCTTTTHAYTTSFLYNSGDGKACVKGNRAVQAPPRSLPRPFLCSPTPTGRARSGHDSFHVPRPPNNSPPRFHGYIYKGTYAPHPPPHSWITELESSLSLHW